MTNTIDILVTAPQCPFTGEVTEFTALALNRNDVVVHLDEPTDADREYQSVFEAIWAGA